MFLLKINRIRYIWTTVEWNLWRFVNFFLMIFGKQYLIIRKNNHMLFLNLELQNLLGTCVMFSYLISTFKYMWVEERIYAEKFCLILSKKFIIKLKMVHPKFNQLVVNAFDLTLLIRCYDLIQSFNRYKYME